MASTNVAWDSSPVPSAATGMPSGFYDMAAFMRGVLLGPAALPRGDEAQHENEAREVREDELLALTSIYGPDFTASDDGLLASVRVRAPGGLPMDDDMALNERLGIGLWLQVVFTPEYPQQLPMVFTDNRGILPRTSEAALVDSLLAEAAKLAGAPMIFDLVEAAAQFLSQMQPMADELAVPALETGVATGAEGEGKGEVELSGDPIYRPSNYVGSAAEVVAAFPSCLGVTGVENILHNDLAEAFEKMQMLLREQYKGDDVSFWTPARMFHGTLACSIPSIVRKGLLIPGGDGVEVRNGECLGRGIYLSPDPSYSMPYTGGSGRLLVCAALSGQPYYLGGPMVPAPSGSRRKVLDNTKKRNSCLVSGNKLEWVYFQASQVLPCYVISFDYKRHQGKRYLATSSGGCLVSIQENGKKALAEEAAEKKRKAQRVRERVEARLKRAEFYFGMGVQVEGCSFDEADEEDDDMEDYRYAMQSACSVPVGCDGSENPWEGEYQEWRWQC